MNEQEMQAKIDELTEELTRAKSGQAGSDKAVQRLQGENQELVHQLEQATGSKESTADRLAQATEKQDRRERVFKMALEKNIDPASALRLLGLGDESDEDRLAVVDDIKMAERQAVLKSAGRSPLQSVTLQGPMDIGQINAMSDDEIKKLDPEMVDNALDDHLGKLKQGKNPTLRTRLTASMFGGRK